MRTMSQLSNRPLNVLPEVQLSAGQMDQLQAIEQYDLWFVTERLADKGIVSPHLIDQAVWEFRRYIALVSLGYDDLGMHSSVVDEVWHAFILFTREYGEFCHRTCGRMIHHTPNTSRRPQLPQPSVPTFKDAYNKYFGAIPRIWATNKLECDAAGEEPDEDEIDIEVEVSSGDCDVVQAPPCKGSADCDADGVDPYQANSIMDTTDFMSRGVSVSS
jgi:hypothetical protein